MAWRDRLRAVSNFKAADWAAIFMALSSRLTDVFVDGLNFYYGAIKGSPYKWLDLRRLAENVLPEHQIGRIYYFTAIVQERPAGGSQPIRQRVYLRALSTIPELEIYLGVFKAQTLWLPAADRGMNPPHFHHVLRVEEKQTDVNLATHLIARAVQGEFEHAAVISDDTDFVGAARYVRDTVGIPVVVLNPNVARRRRVSRELVEASTYVRNILESHLAASQFPDRLTDQHGVITKPESW